MPRELIVEGGRTTFRSSRAGRTLLALLLSFGPPGTARGNPPSAAEPSDAAGLARAYVDALAERLRLDAENDFRRREADRLDSGAGDEATIALATIDAESQRPLALILQENNRPVVAELQRAVTHAAERERKLREDWLTVRTALYAEKLQLYEIQAHRQVAGQLASLLSVDNRWFWLFGLVAMASLVMVAAHDRRHELRRVLNGGRARAMGVSKFLAVMLAVLAVVTLATFVFGDRLYHWLLRAGSGDEISARDEIVEEIRSAAQSVDDRRRTGKDLNLRYEEALARRARKQSVDVPGAATLVEQGQHSQEATERLTALSTVATSMAAELKGDVKSHEKLQQDLRDNADQYDAFVRKRHWIRGGLGAGLLGLVGTGGTLLGGGIRRRKQRTRDTCPLCLGEGTFGPLADARSGGGGHVALDLLQCKNVISEHPFEECEFTFMSMYRDIIKLCFPTLGIPQAGKTHWLAMVYRELNRGNYPDVVQFERIRSTSSDKFDGVVDEILNMKLGPQATQTDRIPHPLVFNFLDRDRCGASNILVNIFDYSGEVTRSQTIEDRQRQRALDGDGFFFFLDPTEPSETQAQALAGFREDLRRIKGIKAGKQVPIPVALCVSKLDLMVNETYADPGGGGVVGNFYRDLGEIGWQLDVRSLEARSRLMARLRDTVWPGWQIERQIDDLFGGRFMFFPMTPVGLDGTGERDLSRRTIAPVGLLEPLLWLLHMNGYPVIRH
ncbi:MAG TPA: hypothetical protein VND64_29470 [Pirellulales bacterium]|nr:hypothetical protein [Pirellulales bacterium]